jgi:hypothetical protein
MQFEYLSDTYRRTPGDTSGALFGVAFVLLEKILVNILRSIAAA